jgi:SAM-dependent methyltransferase
VNFNFERVKVCPLCGGTSFGFAFIGIVDDQAKKVTGIDELPYSTCSCGAIFQEWMMDDATLSEFYTGGTYRESTCWKSPTVTKDNIREEMAGVEQLTKYLNGHKRCLDIGSSTGVLLMYLDAQGAETVGVEPSKNFREASNANVVADISEVEGKFDFISILHVLEHLTRPREMLNTIMNLLTDDGTLLIEVPTNDYSISHPVVFTRKTFLDVLRDTDYRVDEIDEQQLSGERTNITVVARKR